MGPDEYRCTSPIMAWQEGDVGQGGFCVAPISIAFATVDVRMHDSRRSKNMRLMNTVDFKEDVANQGLVRHGAIDAEQRGTKGHKTCEMFQPVGMSSRPTSESVDILASHE